MRTYISTPANWEGSHEGLATVEMMLRSKGLEPVNTMQYRDMQTKEYLRFALIELLSCKAIFLLPNWENSFEGRIESAIARQVGLLVLDAKDAWEEYLNGNS